MRRFPTLSPTSWVTIKTVFSQAFAIALFAVQAPVLGPRAFGLIAIVMVFVGFCEQVLSEAVSEALISIREIAASDFDTMNTVNVLMCTVCGLILYGGAPFAAQLYGDVELAPILRTLAILPLISSMAVAPTAATKRDMQFQPLALRSMVSLFGGGVVGLALTLTGYGVWALVWQALVTRLIATVVLWMAVPLRLRFGFSRGSLAQLRNFALPTFLSRLMGWGSNQFPRLIFGFYWGATDLGLFSLASRLSDIVQDVALTPRYAVARVELRRFAGDPQELRNAARRLLINMSVPAFPMLIGGAAVAPTLFHAWLSPRWYGGIAPAEMLMLGGIPFVTLYSAGAILLALNRQSSEALLSFAQTAITTGVVILCAPLGILPATAAFSARLLLAAPVAGIAVRKQCAIPARLLFEPQRPALIAAAFMGLAVTLLRMSLEPSIRSILLLPLLISAGAVVYGAAIWLLLPDFARQFAARIGLRWRTGSSSA